MTKGSVLLNFILLYPSGADRVLKYLYVCHFQFSAFPKLREGGGFELLKVCGTTRSRNLVLLPCPNKGYHVGHLKDPQNQIGHATVFIRPLQQNLSLDAVSFSLTNYYSIRYNLHEWGLNIYCRHLCATETVLEKLFIKICKIFIKYCLICLIFTKYQTSKDSRRYSYTNKHIFYCHLLVLRVCKNSSDYVLNGLYCMVYGVGLYCMIFILPITL